jgi:hypothetical protein
MDDHHYPAFSYKANLLDGHKIEIMTTETNLLVDAIAQARARTLNMFIKDSLDHNQNSWDQEMVMIRIRSATDLLSAFLRRRRRSGSSSKFLSFSRPKTPFLYLIG